MVSQVGQKQFTTHRTKAMFLTATTTAGEKFFLECFKWIYTPEMDQVIEKHIRSQKTARDVVTKLPPLSEQIEEMKNKAMVQMLSMSQRMKNMRRIQIIILWMMIYRQAKCSRL